jgi:hypothetical protein
VNEHSKRFEAAIWGLDQYQQELLILDNKEDRDDVLAAIVFLKAAQGVDKKKAMSWLNDANSFDRDNHVPDHKRTFEARDMIRPLLEALPDPAKEKEAK